MSLTNKNRINAIQYNSLRLSYKKPIKTKTTSLLVIANTTSIEERVNDLNTRYLGKCFLFNIEIIMELIDHYCNWYPSSKNPKYKTFLCNYREIIFKNKEKNSQLSLN